MAIIIVSGRARSGKDTLAKMLQEVFEEEYFLMSYATELKMKVKDDFGLSSEQLNGSLKEVEDNRYPKEDGTFWTPREILQHIGTQGYRTIENNFWVRKLFERVDRNKLNNVIITDGRFPNEIEEPLKRGGFHIRIERPDKESVHGMDHASETSLDGYTNINYTVINDGSLEDLRDKALYLKKEIENAEKQLQY
jgi:hypothetical protein